MAAPVHSPILQGFKFSEHKVLFLEALDDENLIKDEQKFAEWKKDAKTALEKMREKKRKLNLGARGVAEEMDKKKKKLKINNRGGVGSSTKPKEPKGKK